VLEASKGLPLPQVLEGLGVQLAVSLQELRRLEAVCLKALLGENPLELQDFDRIAQVLDQVAICCEGLSREPGVEAVQVQRGVVDRLTMGEIRQRLLAEAPQPAVSSGEVELF